MLEKPEVLEYCGRPLTLEPVGDQITFREVAERLLETATGEFEHAPMYLILEPGDGSKYELVLVPFSPGCVPGYEKDGVYFYAFICVGGTAYSIPVMFSNHLDVTHGVRRMLESAGRLQQYGSSWDVTLLAWWLSNLIWEIYDQTSTITTSEPKCAVCGTARVDAEAGFDTCATCLSKA